MGLVYRANWHEDGSATVLARVTADDGTGTNVSGEGPCLKQADLSSIGCRVTDQSDASVVVTPSITISSVIYDTLQTDNRWGLDSTGYNFKHTLPTTAFPTGGKTYHVQYTFTTTGSVVGYLKVEGPAVETYGG